MRITFDVSGFYDWEQADKHPGVAITEGDVRALRAKQDASGKWLIRVEKTTDTHHDTCIPELSICDYMAAQAAFAGKEHSRDEAAAHFLSASYRHHGKRSHVTKVTVHDDGPNRDLMTAALAARGITGKVADETMERYLEPVDVQAALTAQFGPRPRKENA